MPKRTKTQKRRALQSIQDKSWSLVHENLISVKDYGAIQRIIVKGLNKL